ncbi:MAG: hypothetical protein JKY65_08280 [Planctomycetes bacterium]|nr:hypothetical protein [Planctomycetota bacterium]
MRRLLSLAFALTCGICLTAGHQWTERVIAAVSPQEAFDLYRESADWEEPWGNSIVVLNGAFTGSNLTAWLSPGPNGRIDTAIPKTSSYPVPTPGGDDFVAVGSLPDPPLLISWRTFSLLYGGRLLSLLGVLAGWYCICIAGMLFNPTSPAFLGGRRLLLPTLGGALAVTALWDVGGHTDMWLIYARSGLGDYIQTRFAFWLIPSLSGVVVCALYAQSAPSQTHPQADPERLRNPAAPEL